MVCWSLVGISLINDFCILVSAAAGIPVSWSSTWSKSFGLRARAGSCTRSSRCVSSSASPVMGVDAVSSMSLCVLDEMENPTKCDGREGWKKNEQKVRLVDDLKTLKTRDARQQAVVSCWEHRGTLAL